MTTMSNHSTDSIERATLHGARFSFFRYPGVLLLLAVLGCGFLKNSETKPLTSEIADASANISREPVRLAHNNEALGTTADLDPLRRKVGSIMRMREDRGVFVEGSNAIENTVYFKADDRMSVGDLVSVILAINESGGKAHLPVKTTGPMSNEPMRPNPLTLILLAGETRPEHMAAYEIMGAKAGQYSVSPTVAMLSDASEVKRTRAVGSSIEISADGEYFYNGPTVYLSTMDIEEVDIIQRPLAAPALKNEVATLITGAAPDAITIVASEFAPAASLFKIFDAVDATKYNWKIVVRQAKRQGTHK
jgi:hypothetical protein